MKIHLDDTILELIKTEHLKTYIVLKVLAGTALYSVKGQVATEEQTEEFIRAMYSEITPEESSYSVKPEELN